MRVSSATLVCFALLCLVQLSVPASMITRKERTLADGTPYRFRVAPIDPVDPFRGRYLRLGFLDTTVPVPEGHGLRRGQEVYGILQADEDGFDRVVRVSEEPPGSSDYLQVEIEETDAGQAFIRLPFDRYYLQEHLAARAERIYRESVSESGSNAFITVRVRDGHGIVEGLFVDGVPIEELARRPIEEGG
jgi:uncharacterized membrane-anchored protein